MDKCPKCGSDATKIGASRKSADTVYECWTETAADGSVVYESLDCIHAQNESKLNRVREYLSDPENAPLLAPAARRDILAILDGERSE